MLTMAFLIGVIAVLAWMTCHRTAAVVAAIFLLFSLITRMLSLAFVDLGEPIYSEQLDTIIGGKQSLPAFACSVLILLGCLTYAFRPAAFARVSPPACPGANRRDGIRTLMLLVTVTFLAALYADMLSRGLVPLLMDMDRLEYNVEYAGPLHGALLDYGFLFAGVLGAMFVRPRIVGREFDGVFFALYAAVLAYFVLTGNRFSSFYSFTSFFVIPLACLPALASAGKLPPPPPRRIAVRIVYSPWTLMFLLASGVIGLAALIVHSVVNVRDYDDPMNQLIQRVLVQPVELWWVTWRELGTVYQMPFAQVWELLFSNPIDADRNTSIQMLMVKNVGYERARELLNMGQQYTGGYPEVLFELLGPWFALPAALVLIVPSVLILRLTVVAVCEDRLLTAFMALYVYFGFSLLFIGGMLNFLTVWSFWAKIAALAFVYVLEQRSGTPERGSDTRVSPHPALSSSPQR